MHLVKAIVQPVISDVDIVGFVNVNYVYPASNVDVIKCFVDYIDYRLITCVHLIIGP